MEISVDYHGLTIKGDLIKGAYEGDPDVPGGLRKLPTYIDDLAVIAPDGYDITDEFCDLDKLEAYAVEQVGQC